MRRTLLLVATTLLVTAGCGEENEVAPTDTDTTTAPADTTNIRVYFLRDGKVWPVSRQVETGDSVAAAVDVLDDGPTAQEKNDLSLTSAVPAGSLAIDESGAVTLEEHGEPYDAELAQIVYTLTQFAGTNSVEVDGEAYTRADFEAQTPAILVESPLAFEEASSPLRATGTANTFEANFQYEVTDTDGRIVDENFVTATSGTGTRGTFGFTTDEFTVPFDGIGALVVFELSAKDGSRINLVEIPLKMSD